MLHPPLIRPCIPTRHTGATPARRSIVRWMRDVGTLSPDLGFVMLRSVDPHKGPTMVCMVSWP